MLAFKVCKAELTASVCYLPLFSSAHHLGAFPVHDTGERGRAVRGIELSSLLLVRWTAGSLAAGTLPDK